MVVSTDAWRVIRTLRSQPPGLAAVSGARRTTFQAALEQSEELWTAAERVGPSVSPILLFYSLNQAGYAFLAARARRQWGSAGSHGARATYSGTGSGDRVHLDEFTVAPTGRGSISRIAQLSQSVLPSCPVSVADLICSLPQADHLYGRRGAPRPLLVRPGLARDHRSTNRCLTISNLPPSLVRHDEGRGLEYFVAPSPEEVVEWLSVYPTVAALGKPVSIVQGTPPDLHRLGIDVPVILEWRHEEGLPELVDFTTHLAQPLLVQGAEAGVEHKGEVSLLISRPVGSAQSARQRVDAFTAVA